MRSFLLLVLVLPACRTVGWDGKVERWGSMREVMREGRTEGRVLVFSAAHGPDTVGIGALAELAGEVSIVDGATWITRSTASGRLATSQGAAADAQAALLVTASVPEWVELPVDRDIALDDIPEWAGFAAREWSVAPFVVRGKLLDVETHVLHGACPYAGDVPTDRQPVRRKTAFAFGTLVGFWARDGAGTITHAGQSVHAHAIVRGEESYTAHVDRVRIGAGSVLLVPRDREHVSPSHSISRTY